MSTEARLLEFMTDTSKSLGRIEANQENLQKDFDYCRPQIDRIPLIEKGLSNHLTSHNRLRTYFVWPVSVIVSASIILSFLHWVIRVF